MRYASAAAALFLFLPACDRARPPADPQITVRLTREGGLLYAGRRLTLERFARLVADKSDTRTEVHEAGYPVSALVCRLQIDADACWRHVQWLITILAEVRVWKLRFVCEGSEIPWELPIDRCLPASHAEPDARILQVRVYVDANGALFGGDIAGGSERVRAEGLDAMIGQIRAAGRARWADCAAVLERFLEAGAARVDLYGTAIPGPDLRARDPLPAPGAEGRPRSWGGEEVLAAWRLGGTFVFDEEIIEEEETEGVPGLPAEEIVEEPIEAEDE